MKKVFLGLLLFMGWPTVAQDTKIGILPTEIQIKTAVMPVPEKERDAAMVYGYNNAGELVVLRKGTNNLVCIGDNPSKKGINVACYSKKMEPFMARGRELSAKGLSGEEREKIREKEVASGQLKMPSVPSMMYVYYGKEEDYDTKTGELQNAKLRYVIYTPFATTESTGLPDKPHAPGMPWLMDPGTHRAHIMVGPF